MEHYTAHSTRGRSPAAATQMPAGARNGTSTAATTSGHADPTRSPATVAEAVARTVAERSGAVFGLMGNGNAHVVSDLTSRGAPFTSMRHEAGAVSAAQAYYLTSGQVATATCTYGAGFTNTLTALAEARRAGMPLVLVTGGTPAEGQRWWDIDQQQAASALDVTTIEVGPNNAISATHEAFDTAYAAQQPVIVALPFGQATQKLTREVPTAERVEEPAERVEQPAERVEEPAPHAGSKQLDRVAEALQHAQRPLVLAGRGAHLAGAGPHLQTLADRLGGRMATSVMAMGLFDSPWDLGVAGGFSSPASAELMAQADVVLVAGMSLNNFQMRGGELLAGAERIIQLDLTDRPRQPQVTDVLVTDAAAGAAALLERISPATGTTWRERVPQTASALRRGQQLPEHASDGRLDPRALVCRLDELLPQQRTVVQDGGHFVGWFPRFTTVPDPGAMILVGTAFQTIGQGFPSGVGAAAARPEALTVMVSGDGGGLMALPDLVTFVRNVRRGVIVIFNDAAYGAELHQYASIGLDDTAMVIDEVDFASLARALGADGHRVTALADLDVLTTWLAADTDGVLLLDVAISRDVVADFMKPASHG